MRLGRYELLRRVARGGMAEVWAARQVGQLGFSRTVAIKMILPEFAEDASFRKMFLEEARLASGIRHVNVVEVLDLGEAESIVFQAMPLLEGDSLLGLMHRWQRAGRPRGLPEKIVVRVLSDALAGLHAAHELKDEEGHLLHVVHRDVSPQNVLVGLDGVARIADFGVAKALGRLSEETEAGQIKGKFAYLAPELLERQDPDRRSDIFSAGVVLWEALTATRLFKGKDAIETLSLVRSLDVPDPRSVNAAISPRVAEVTMRALERDPEERFASAAEMADALNQAARSASAEVSTNELSAFVGDLIAATDARPWDQTPSDRVAKEAETLLAAAAIKTRPERTAIRRSGPSRAWMGWGAIVVLAAGLSAVLVHVRANHASPPADAPALAVSPSAPPVAEATSTTAVSIGSKADSSPSAPPAPAAIAPIKANHSSRRAPSPSNRPRKPKFGNPYDR
jgi:serine/threonine-protein kinase